MKTPIAAPPTTSDAPSAAIRASGATVTYDIYTLLTVVLTFDNEHVTIDCYDMEH